MDTLLIVICIVYSVLSVANIIASVALKNAQEKSDICTFALYTELKRFNDNQEKENGD